MSELTDLGISEASRRIRSGETSAKELTEAHVLAAQSAAPLNAYTEITVDAALASAMAADRRISAGEDSPLLGIPVAVKDLFCTRGIRSHACSRILEGFRPHYESTVTSKIWSAGAVLLGKCNMDEFAMGSSTEMSADGPAINPWRRIGDDTPLSPGGSSGGSAIAVAARTAIASLGTDTGGSIRQPAALTGTVGVKPTYGRCSRWGIVAFASSLDQAGIFTRSIADAALMLRAISGHDDKDSTSANLPVPDFSGALGDSIRGWRIGLPREYRLEGMADEATALWDRAAAWLVDSGAEIVDISLPHTRFALAAYYIIAPAEASSNLARYDGVRYGRRIAALSGEDVHSMYERTRREGFGPEVRRRVLIGTYALSSGYYDAYYLRAQRVRTLVRRDFEDCFRDGIDAILTPTTPTPAFPVGAKSSDPIEMYLNDVFTVPVNLAGLPGVSVPGGTSREGLPLGLQVIGQPWKEAEMLTIAKRLEEAAGSLPAPNPWWAQ